MRSSGARFHSGAIFKWIAAAVLFAPFGMAQALGPLPDNRLFEHIAVGAIAIFRRECVNDLETPLHRVSS